jgi:hypothetical protein
VFTARVENAATGIELLAVAIIVGVIVVATLSYLSHIIGRRADANTYTEIVVQDCMLEGEPRG